MHLSQCFIGYFKSLAGATAVQLEGKEIRKQGLVGNKSKKIFILFREEKKAT